MCDVTITKQTGAPDPKYYEQTDVVNSFDEIRQWLIKNFRKYLGSEPLTNKQLATLTSQLLTFQEESFGKNASNPLLTKLPFYLFNDISPGGGLSCILATCFKVKFENSWRRFDFTVKPRGYYSFL